MRGRGAAVAVGEPGRVAQQVLDRWRLLRRARAAGGFRDLPLRQRREIFRYRVGEQHAPFLDQRHDGNGCHRLGHGGNGEDGVGFQRLLASGIAQAHGFEMRNPALARDGDDGAGYARGLDLAPQRRTDAPEPGTRQADGLRLVRQKSGGRHWRTYKSLKGKRAYRARRLITNRPAWAMFGLLRSPLPASSCGAVWQGGFQWSRPRNRQLLR